MALKDVNTIQYILLAFPKGVFKTNLLGDFIGRLFARLHGAVYNHLVIDAPRSALGVVTARVRYVP